MCGGCGETDSRKRCMGCLHDFGTPDSSWVRGVVATQPEGNAPTIGEGVPSGMVPWHGGDSAPADWDGGDAAARFDDGTIEIIKGAYVLTWRHDDPNAAPIIAYTPKAQPRSPYSGVAREAVARIIDPRRWEMHEWAKANSATPFNVTDLLAKADAILAALSEHQGIADAGEGPLLRALVGDTLDDEARSLRGRFGWLEAFMVDFQAAMTKPAFADVWQEEDAASAFEAWREVEALVQAVRPVLDAMLAASPPQGDRVADLVAAVDAWQSDPTPEAEQRILDARTALSPQTQSSDEGGVS